MTVDSNRKRPGVRLRSELAEARKQIEAVSVEQSLARWGKAHGRSSTQETHEKRAK